MAHFPLKPVSMDDPATTLQSWELFQVAFEKYLVVTKQKDEPAPAPIKAALLCR